MSRRGVCRRRMRCWGGGCVVRGCGRSCRRGWSFLLLDVASVVFGCGGEQVGCGVLVDGVAAYEAIEVGHCVLHLSYLRASPFGLVQNRRPVRLFSASNARRGDDPKLSESPMMRTSTLSFLRTQLVPT